MDKTAIQHLVKIAVSQKMLEKAVSKRLSDISGAWDAINSRKPSISAQRSSEITHKLYDKVYLLSVKTDKQLGSIAKNVSRGDYKLQNLSGDAQDAVKSIRASRASAKKINS